MNLNIYWTIQQENKLDIFYEKNDGGAKTLRVSW